MTTKHTSGPWEVTEGEASSHKVMATTPRGLKKSIAQVGGYGGESRSANARLMAAAPDLLEALQLCLHVVNLSGFKADYCAEKARSALAKATGESA